MSGGGALRAAWEAAQKAPVVDSTPASGDALRKAWEAAQVKPNRSTAPFKAEEPPEMPHRVINTEPAKPSLSDKIRGGVESSLNSVPFVGGAMATIRSLGSQQPTIGPKPPVLSHDQAAQQISDEASAFDKENPRTALAGKLGANVAAFELSPLKAIQGAVMAKRAGGAILGGVTAAAQRASSIDHPSESLGQKALGTVGAGAVGAGVGAVAPWALSSPIPRTLIGAGTGAYLAPEGHGTEGALAGGAAALSAPSLAKAAAPLLGPKLQEILTSVQNATGTRGVVNKEMEGINQIAKPLGTVVGEAAPTGARKVVQAERFGEQSKKLYDVARNSSKVLDDPRTLALINDPDLSEAFASVDRIRGARGNPLPTGVVGQRTVVQPGETFDVATAQSPKPTLRQALSDFDTRKGVAARRTEGTVQQQMARTGLERHGAESVVSPPLSGAPGTRTLPDHIFTENVEGKVPDPEALHLLKRIVRDVVDKGFSKLSPMSNEEALVLQPKLQALTEHLHNVSPEYQAADRFFQLGKVSGKASTLGYGAATPAMRSPSPTALGTKDVAGAKAYAEGQSHADPMHALALQRAARTGVESGARGQLAQQVAAKDISGGRAGVLSAPAFDLSGPAFAQRQLALGIRAPAFENTLARQRAEIAADAGKPGIFSKGVSMLSRGHVQPTTPASKIQTAINSPEGQKMLAEIVANPSKYQQVLQSYQTGRGTVDLAKAVTAMLAGSAVGGSTP